MPSVRAIGIDISSRALDVARRNGQRHGVMGRFALVQANELSAFTPRPIFSAIVSNPPYIPAKDIDGLQPEVRDHEPLSALIAGDDGLSYIRALVRDGVHFLQTNGYLIFEIGFDQSDSVRALVNPTFWDLVQIKNDLQNIARVLVLRKK
jgi:release factor glutamine methyltransferase